MDPVIKTHLDPSAIREKQRSRFDRILSAVQFFVALGLAVSFLCYLYFSGLPNSQKTIDRREKEKPLVVALGGGLIRVEPGTPLAQRLELFEVKRVKITQPLIVVTGTVAASFRDQGGINRLQFNSTEVLSTYNDWMRAKGDVDFSTAQLVAVSDLAKARRDAQKKAFDRLEKLVQAGTDSEKDLAAARADMLQSEIQSRKDLYEANTAILVAKRNELALSRQLQQVGLEPELLGKLHSEIDIVMADVPEIWYSQVKLGQACEARFFGLPGKTFSGRVLNLPPLVTKERRSLRVLFTINDPDDLLRPGMFAEIDLDTDPRDVLMVPSEGIIHIGRADYVLIGTKDPSTWEIREVNLGIARLDRTEILKGLKDGDRVLGAGAILIKPLMVDQVSGRKSP